MKKSYRIALSGVLSALAVTVLFLGSVIPFATFVAPAIASVCVLFFCIEYSNKTAFAVYFVIAVIAVLVVPDKELALIFALVVGYVPVLKSWAERKLPPAAAYAFKFVVFNITVIGMYFLAIYVFRLPLLAEEFSGYTTVFVILLLAGGNAALFLFDRALTALAALYNTKIRPKLQ